MTQPRSFRLTRPEPTEAAVLSAILRALRVHPAVAGFWRQNTGAFAVGEGQGKRYFRSGPKGSPDIHGYLTDGRALFIETKRPGGRITPEQRAFIKGAASAGCAAFFAYSVSDAWAVLNTELQKMEEAKKLLFPRQSEARPGTARRGGAGHGEGAMRKNEARHPGNPPEIMDVRAE